MLECLILGDSIGLGISQVKKECQAFVKSGINSTDYVNKFGPVNQYNKHTIISLGSNDTKDIKTYESLFKLRYGIKARCVTWILPSSEIKPEQFEIVKKVASIKNDFIISPSKKLLNKDKIHPTYSGYKSLSNDIDKATCN
jgi:hypothetical protein